MRQIAVSIIAALVVVPIAWASSGSTQECPGFFVWEGVGPVCPLEGGLFEVLAPDGRSLGTISHVDPVTDEPDPVFPSAANDVQCVTSTEQYAIWVIYARATNDADGYAARAPTIRNLVAGAQQMVSDAAAATGGTSKLKVLCSGGTVEVKNEVLPTSLSGDSFSSIVNDLENKGYNDPKKKYWVFYDAVVQSGVAGTGHWASDSSNSVSNIHNGNANQAFFAVSFASESVRTMLHELSHNLGAVQNGAPSYSGTDYGHCVDGKDTLCYDDGGQNTGSCSDFYCSGTCSVEVWDCNKNTYYNLNPTASTWLATHWNIGASYVRFLSNVKNSAPTMTSLSCTPANAAVGTQTDCTFSATDSASQVAYNVNWADGATQRVPATGFVASGTSLSASHTYGWDGTFAISVTATDNDPAPLTSSPLTSSVTLQAAPVMNLFSCSPDPSEVGATVSCSFRAADNSTGVYYEIDWGDGSAIQRVPSTGTVAPGVTRTATHVWTSVASYTLSATATDNGSPVLTSNARTTSISIVANMGPVMDLLSCSPNPVFAQEPTTCSFRANDGSSSLFYELDWGDGSALQRVPASGTVPSGATQTAPHTYAANATYTLSVRATDTNTPPATGSPMTTSVIVTPPNAVPVMVDLSCPTVAVNQTTTCSFRATDTDSTGVKYTINWGDGVTTTFPASGFVTPGVTRNASHAYASAGQRTVTVTPTDNGTSNRVGLPMTTTALVSGDDRPPILSIQTPDLHTAYFGCTLDWDIVVGDPLFVTRGCVRATATDVSGVAHVKVYVNGNLVGTDTTAPYQFDFPVPRGDIGATLTVVATDTIGNAKSASMSVNTV